VDAPLAGVFAALGAKLAFAIAERC